MGKLIKFAHVNEHGDFEKVLSHLNIDYQKKGAQLRLLCPFHDDTNPSLSVTLGETDSAKVNTWHCFGCGHNGSVIDFVAQAKGVDLRAAAELIDQICGCGLAPPRASKSKGKSSKRGSKGSKTSTKGNGRKPPEKPDTEHPGDDQDLSDTEVPNAPLSFSLTLDTDHQYVRDRIGPAAAMEFGVGVCDPEGRSIMAGRCCVPLHDAAGALIGYAGRYLGDDPDEPKWKLPPKFNKMLALYNAHRVQGAEHVVLVEGCFDAIRLHSLAIPSVACIGTAVSEEQIALLRELGARRITVLFDGDDEGQAAADRAVPLLARAFFVRVGSLPDGVDPAEAEQSVLVEQARGGW